MGSILMINFVFIDLEITRKGLEKKTDNNFRLDYVCSNGFECRKTRLLKLKEHGGGGAKHQFGCDKNIGIWMGSFLCSLNLIVAAKFNSLMRFRSYQRGEGTSLCRVYGYVPLTRVDFSLPKIQNRPYLLKFYSNLVSNAQLKCQNPSCFQLLFPAA